jgi:YggT family protein
MLIQAAQFVLEAFFGLFIFAALLRFFAQTLRASFRNPIGEFVIALTNFAVLPLRKVVPSFFKLDLATLALAFLLELALVLSLLVLGGFREFLNIEVMAWVLALALLRLIGVTLYLLIGALVVQAVLSWVSPYHAVAPFFDALTRPFLKHLRRIMPTVGGIDLSPLVLLVICQLLLVVVLKHVDAQALKQLYLAVAGI